MFIIKNIKSYFKSKSYTVNPVQASEKYVYGYFNLFCYAFLSAPIFMVFSASAIFTNKFLLDEAKLSANKVSIVIFVSRSIDAITDPISGYLVNKAKIRKYGKMKPWIVLFTPILMISFFFMFYIPRSFSQNGLVAWYTIWHGLFYTVMGDIRIPHMSIVMYLTDCKKKRELSTVVRCMFEILGILSSMILENVLVHGFSAKCEVPLNSTITNETLPYDLVYNETNNVTAVMSKTFFEDQRYMLPSVIFLSITLVAYILFIVFVKEKTDLIINDTSKENYNSIKSVWLEIKRMHKYKPYLLLSMIGICTQVAPQVVEAYMQLFFEYSFTIAKDFFPIVGGGILGLSIVYAPLWNFLMRKFGKKIALIAGNMTPIPLFIAALIVSKRFEAYIFCALGVIAANAFTVWFVIPFAMVPDFLDEYYAKFKTRPDALVFTFFAFYVKIITSIYFAVSQLILNASGYLSNICSEYQPKAVSLTIRLIFTPTPLLCIAICIITTIFYPINDKTKRKQDIIPKEGQNKTFH